MEAIEAVAIIILIIAILVLVYYYLLNTTTTMNKLKSYIPTNADAHMSEVISKNTDYNDLQKEKEKQSESMTKRIKVKLSDIDMSGINTDAFSKKLDAFLDEKSDELIKDWSLATTNDLKELESKFTKTTTNVDNLDKSFKEFKKSSEEFQKATEEKLNYLDKRIESLENN
jgi:hypothetical protein